MIFVKSNYFEVTLANWRKDDFHDEVLICVIDENFQVIEYAPVELFIGSRNMAIIYGRTKDGDYSSKSLMQVGTKKQTYAGWDPINSSEDFWRMVQKKIDREKGKTSAYEKEPKKYPFWKMYGGMAK